MSDQKLVGEFQLSFRKSYYVLRPHLLVLELCQHVKHLWQRARRGWADCDAWSLDYYLNMTMPGAIRRIKDKGLGYPIDFENSPNGHERWRAILEEIAQGFEAAKKINEMEFETPEESIALQKKTYKGLGLFCKYYFNLWD